MLSRADANDPVIVFIASRDTGPTKRRVLWIVSRADAMKICSDDRTSNNFHMLCWSAEWLDDPGNEFIKDKGNYDHVLRDHDVDILDSLALQMREAA